MISDVGDKKGMRSGSSGRVERVSIEIIDCTCVNLVIFLKNTVTGPLRDRYGTVTGVPLISVNVLIFPTKSAYEAHLR